MACIKFISKNETWKNVFIDRAEWDELEKATEKKIFWEKQNLYDDDEQDS